MPAKNRASAVNAALVAKSNPMTPPQHQRHVIDPAIDLAPHPEVFEKKKEVLQDLAAQKQAVKEAKGFNKGYL